MQALHEIKFVSDYVIRGRAIVFGGRDLQGDTFTKYTDFCSSRPFDGLPIFYDHALSTLKSQIGELRPGGWMPNDEGIDVEIELYKNHKYIKYIMQILHSGKMGLSSGALSHLVERKANILERWPAGEISITPHPAEPRTWTSVKSWSIAEAVAHSSASGSRTSDIDIYNIVKGMKRHG